MKKILILLFVLTTLPLFAYQTGSASRAKFASSSQEEGQKQTTVPGQQGVQTRSFTSYGARQGGWRKGVQTQSVKTQTVGKPAPESEQAEEKTASSPAQPEIQSVAASTPAKPVSASAPKTENNISTKKTAPETSEIKATTSTASGRVRGTITFKPEQAPAAMEVFQNMVGGMQGGKGEPAAAPNMPAGMPDLSTLMNMAGQGNTGKK